MSVVKDLAIAKSSVAIYEGLSARVGLRFGSSRKESHSVELEKRFEQISTTVFKHALNLIVTGVVPESLIVQVGFVKLDRGALIAQHVLLEGQETQVPGITFLISNEPGNRGWVLDAGTESELPDAAINISEAHEGSPVLQMLSLVRGQGHHPNIGDHVLIVDVVKDEL